MNRSLNNIAKKLRTWCINKIILKLLVIIDVILNVTSQFILFMHKLKNKKICNLF